MLNKYLVLTVGVIGLGVSSLALSAAEGYPPICKSDDYICVRAEEGRIMVVPRSHIRSHDPVRKTVSYHEYNESREDTNLLLPQKISASNIINVDLSKLTWGAYDANGDLVNSGHVSGGKSFCPDIGRSCKTVTGTYTVYEKRGAECKSTRFPVGKGGAPMPYCMFFHGGYALHGSNAVPNYNASHGCVRMSPADARWLNENFVEIGRTRVHVKY